MKEAEEKVKPVQSYNVSYHCIIRPESSSTKLRLMFNESALTASGVSFNELQMVGPTLRSVLFSILIRFRKRVFVVGEDVETMYRPVLIYAKQHSLQRILWRFDDSDPIRTYKLVTITYGTAAASFFAIRFMMELALKCEKTDPTIAKSIRHVFYVNCLLTGADTIKEATIVAKRLTEILAIGCFNLRKWIPNSPEIIQKITVSQETAELVNLSCD